MYIWEWRTEPLIAKKVADTFHISVNALNAELRSAYGGDFRHLLNRARVAYAYPALFQDGISIQSLTNQAGFSNEKAFSRAFHEVFGCSPQKYRERLLDSEDSRIVHLIQDKVLDVMGYLLNNYRLPITIKDCAQALFLTESDIKRVLKFVFPRRIS